MILLRDDEDVINYVSLDICNLFNFIENMGNMSIH
jgi:hypothetical protein